VLPVKVVGCYATHPVSVQDGQTASEVGNVAAALTGEDDATIVAPKPDALVAVVGLRR
jgi:hypothetical protein